MWKDASKFDTNRFATNAPTKEFKQDMDIVLAPNKDQ